MKLVYLIRSIVFVILFALSTALVAVLFSPFLVFRCKPIYWTGITWCRISLFLLRVICGIKYKVTGYENLPKGHYIIASKHQSTFETVLFWDIFYIPTFILKKELTKLPFFGIYLVRMKMICIDRNAGASALKQIISEAHMHIEENRKIVIYPEGTRREPGQVNENYNSAGVMALYRNCNVPIVPVALNSGVFWPKDGWIKYPGVVEIKILPAIKPGLDKDAFMKKLNHDIEQGSLELYKKANKTYATLRNNNLA